MSIASAQPCRIPGYGDGPLVRDVHCAAGTVTAVAVIVGVLAIGLLGARAFEGYDLSWAPFAPGGMVAAFVFVAPEILRRATKAKLAAEDA